MGTRLESALHEMITEANERWRLWRPGERVVVGVSGGKDSLALLHLLASLNVEIVAAHVQVRDPLPSPTADWVRARARLVEIPVGLLAQVEGKGNPCFACSRLRRRALLETARDGGAALVALGHHREDVAHTLLLNMLYSREMSTMTPRQPLFDGAYHIIRPMYLVPESMLESLRRELNAPLAPKSCPYDGHTRRARIAEMLDQLQAESPTIDLTDNLFAALFRRNENFLPSERLEE